jgi:hypothetical protein
MRGRRARAGEGGGRDARCAARARRARRAHLVAHRRVLLLTGRVQDVEQASLLIDRDLLAVRVFDGRVVLSDEKVLDQLDRERRLAHAAAAHHNELVLCHGQAESASLVWPAAYERRVSASARGVQGGVASGGLAQRSRALRRRHEPSTAGPRVRSRAGYDSAHLYSQWAVLLVVFTRRHPPSQREGEGYKEARFWNDFGTGIYPARALPPEAACSETPTVLSPELQTCCACQQRKWTSVHHVFTCS